MKKYFLLLVLLCPSWAGAQVIYFDTLTGEVRFDIEIARDEAAQQKGLMYVKPEEFADHQAMLFLYDEPQIVKFWMKNTYVPLDMIFIDRNKRVSKIVTRNDTLSLRSTSSDVPVLAVVEINAGLAAEYGIGKGSKVRFDLER